MIKKVRTIDLKLGMFIHDLNCGWMDHSFLRSRFMLRKQSDLQWLRESAIREVYIDTLKGLDAEGSPSQAEVEADLATRMREAAQPDPAHATTTHREELAFAKQVQKEASEVIHSILGDARLGKQIHVERLEPVVGRITESILRNPGTLVSLCRLREGDTYTFQHSVSVSTLLVSFCNHMGLPADIIQQAGMGGMLHDIGKMRVPDDILNKPGKLTEDEFAVMKSHVTLGVEILQRTPGISQTVMEVTAQHHERFGGGGYPFGLKGGAISLLGRMASIVDVYDAITSTRIYHKGMEPPAALTKLFEWSEHHFDPELVQRFIQAIGIYPVGSLVRLSSRRLAVVTDQGGADLLHPRVRVVYDIRRQRAVGPLELDLSGPEAAGDGIVGGEDPEAWGLDPFIALMRED